MKIADTTQRTATLCVNRSFIVRAPAGSGKTELLIRRYLKLLTVVDRPEEIIAITFTRKAAAEMRERIISALWQVQKNQTPQDKYEKERYELAAEVNERNEKLNWCLQHNSSCLRVQTIDSLCLFLAKQMPVLSGLSGEVEVLENADDLFLEAAERTIKTLESNNKDWSEPICKLLYYLDNNVSRLKELLADMLHHRDQWLRYLDDERTQRDKLENILQSIISEKLSNTQLLFNYHPVDELISLLQFATENLSAENSDSPIGVCGTIAELPGNTPTALPRWQAIAEFLLLSNKDEWRKIAGKNQGFPAGSNMKIRYKALLSALSEDDALKKNLDEIRYLPNAKLKDSQWEMINVLFRCLMLTEAQLRVLFSEHNSIDFSGIKIAALQALKNNDDLALSLDYQIQHLLVDEFQDVSIGQYELLETLTEGWQDGDGHSLFLVGDPMQSIYRFRQAEVGNFMKIFSKQCFGQMPLEPLSLNVNFRSQQKIVDWFNLAFEKIMPSKQDITSSAVTYLPAIANNNSIHGNVVVHPLLKNEQNNSSVVEAKQIVALIKREQQRSPNSEIAILVRNRRQLGEIMPQLRQSDIHFQAVNIEPLGNRKAIRDCLALMRALLHPMDRVAWLAILRAPWCGMTLSDLYNLVGDDNNTDLWEHICDEIKVKNISQDGQQRLQKIRTVMAEALAQKQRRSLHRQIELMWLQLGGPATLEEKSDLENVRTFFRLLQKQEENPHISTQIEEKIKRLYAVPDIKADTKLQIMTIHNAKGLEFDTVILPGLEKRGRQDKEKLLLWQELMNLDGHSGLLLAPIRATGIEEGNLYKYLKILDKQKQENEEDRLLYVAATRAKKQLHLFGTIAEKDSGLAPEKSSALARLWPIVRDDYKIAAANHSSATTNGQPQVTKDNGQLIKHPTHWALPEPPTSVNWQKANSNADDTDIKFEWASATIQRIGSVVHQYIRQIAVQGLTVWNLEYIKSMRPCYITALKSLGVNHSEIDAAAKTIQQALTNMISSERGQWLLSKDHLEAKNEYALTGIYNEQLINIKIDRTFLDAQGTRWIVDYKTGRHQDTDIEIFLDQEQQRYRKQLEKYAMLISMLEDKPICLGLYFPLLQSWRAWSYQ